MPRAFQRYRRSFGEGDSSPEHSVSLAFDMARPPEQSGNIDKTASRNVGDYFTHGNTTDEFYNLTKLAEVAEQLSQKRVQTIANDNSTDINKNHTSRIMTTKQIYIPEIHDISNKSHKRIIMQPNLDASNSRATTIPHKIIQTTNANAIQFDRTMENKRKSIIENNYSIIRNRNTVMESSEEDSSSNSDMTYSYEHKIFDKIPRKNKSNSPNSSKSDAAETDREDSSDRDETTVVNRRSFQQVSSSAGTEELHGCSDCGKKYSTSSNLARHRQTHRSLTDARAARRCPHCDKVYVSVPAYSMHVRTHARGCECAYCGKRFSRPWLLQGHIRTHTGEKPFKCAVCSKAFADKSNLRAHVQTHSNTKPHVCTRCGKAFALKSYLYKHEESSCVRQSDCRKPGRQTPPAAEGDRGESSSDASEMQSTIAEMQTRCKTRGVHSDVEEKTELPHERNAPPQDAEHRLWQNQKAASTSPANEGDPSINESATRSSVLQIFTTKRHDESSMDCAPSDGFSFSYHELKTAQQDQNRARLSYRKSDSNHNTFHQPLDVAPNILSQNDQEIIHRSNNLCSHHLLDYKENRQNSVNINRDFPNDDIEDYSTEHKRGRSPLSSHQHIEFHPTEDEPMDFSSSSSGNGRIRNMQLYRDNKGFRSQPIAV